MGIEVPGVLFPILISMLVLLLVGDRVLDYMGDWSDPARQFCS